MEILRSSDNGTLDLGTILELGEFDATAFCLLKVGIVPTRDINLRTADRSCSSASDILHNNALSISTAVDNRSYNSTFVLWRYNSDYCGVDNALFVQGKRYDVLVTFNIPVPVERLEDTVVYLSLASNDPQIAFGSDLSANNAFVVLLEDGEFQPASAGRYIIDTFG